jgi:hypothetical protein
MDQKMRRLSFSALIYTVNVTSAMCFDVLPGCHMSTAAGVHAEVCAALLHLHPPLLWVAEGLWQGKPDL